MEAGEIEAVIAEEDEFEDHATWGALVRSHCRICLNDR